MNEKFVKLRVWEPRYGASTEAILLINHEGIVIGLCDTSTLYTGYFWDGWGDTLNQLKGKTLDDVRSFADSFFKGQDFGSYRPYIEVIEA